MTEQAAQPATGPGDLRGKLTPEEVVDSLTGFDEIAIEKATGGRTLEWLTKNDHEIQMLRALGAVVVARSDGVKIEQAYHETVNPMPQSEVKGLFAPDEDDDVMPDEPDSESGKDASLPESEPTTWPTSVSRLA